MPSPWPTSLIGMPVFSCTASTKPPFAEPSSFVSTRPVTPGVLDERLRLREPVLPGRRVEHEQHLGDRRQLLDDAAHLAELVHQAALGLQPAGGVDQHDLDALALRLLDGLEGDRGRILALLLRPHDLRARRAPPRSRAARPRPRGTCRPRRRRRVRS